ncbi:MAG: DUF1573 domain-containing protein [Flavobacterium sp.]
MIKKTVYLFVLASFVLTTSCKKNEEDTKVISEISAETEVKTTPIATTEPAKPAVPADGKYPVMAFDKTEHDFGIINIGDKVEYSFNFKNTGEADLIIVKAVGSCGCTVPEYPKEAIKPGESAKMKVSFDSKGKHGQQQKSVTITTNTEKGTESLLIKASIKE